MEVDEFISGPCCWTQPAPARLRRYAPGGESGWRSYSTSRYVDGVQPRALYPVAIDASMTDANLNVELLPETVAEKWRDLDLQFATEADLIDMGFLAILVKSLDVIRVVRPLLGTVAGVCRSLHVLLAPGEDTDVSFSDPCLPFSVFVSCPPAEERDRVERLAESMVHEALHLQLSLVESVEQLVTDVPDEKLVVSPWKGEGRTARGLLHAVYVFGNLRYFWKSMVSNAPDSSSFARSRGETINADLARAAHLAESGTLTAAGRKVADSFLTA